jgi:hypothetical protein
MSQINRNKTMSKKKGKTKDDKKNQFDKRRKDNKTLSQNTKRGGKKNFDRRQEGTEDQGFGT